MVRDVWLKTAIPNQEGPAVGRASRTRSRPTAPRARPPKPNHSTRRTRPATQAVTIAQHGSHRSWHRRSTPRRYATSHRPPTPGRQVPVDVTSTHSHAYQLVDSNRDSNPGAHLRLSTHTARWTTRTVVAACECDQASPPLTRIGRHWQNACYGAWLGIPVIRQAKTQE